MALIEVEPGVEIHVQDVGSGDPVVLLAGFGLSHEAWDGEVRELVAAGRRAICIDLRGTGGSSKPATGYEIDRIVADVAAVLAALDLMRVVVVGWSFGGQVGLSLAARIPERIAGLVLLCSNGVRASRSDDFPFGPPPGPLEKALVRGECNGRVEMRRRAIASGFRGEPDAGVVDWLLRCQLQMPSWAAVACYRTYLHTDLVATLAAVRLPVLQIMGADDPVTPVEAAPWVQERLADARLVVLDECGHYPMVETRDAFHAALLGFVAEGAEG